MQQFPLHDMQWLVEQNAVIYILIMVYQVLILYMDLDVIILKNIDCFATFTDSKTFNITSDFNGRHDMVQF